MMQKTVNAKAKAGLRSSIIVRDLDSHCLRGHCLSQNTFAKVQTQGLTAKEPKPKEFWPKKAQPANGKFFAPPRFNEAVKLHCQEKKKEYQKKKQNRKNPSLAIRDNAIEGGSEKKKSDGKYYNLLKKSILLGTIQNLQKTNVGLGNLCSGD